jgi:hypothetical protein
MKTAENKTTTSHPSHDAKGSQPFFNKDGAGSFFSKESPQPGFFFSPTTIQPKLTIGSPNDPYEQEADAMADKVVQRLAADSGRQTVDGGRQTVDGGRQTVDGGRQTVDGGQQTVDDGRQTVDGPPIQRKCAACEEGENLQKKEVEEEEIMPQLQRKAIFESNEEQPPVGSVQRKADAGASEASSDLENRLGASRGSGHALPDATRSSMESAFGADFSSVRVHTGSEAVQMNKELGAQAFTHGSDIYFGSGKYDTGSAEGQRLLGHELTHVVQQGGGIQRKAETQHNADNLSLLHTSESKENSYLRTNGHAIQRLILTTYPWHGVISTTSGAYLRSTPNGTMIRGLPRGTPVQVVGSAGDWLRVETRYSGHLETGYVHHPLIDDAASSEMQSMVGNSATWTPSGPPMPGNPNNTFAQWAIAATEGPAPTLTPSTTINCWEMVLLAAFRARVINWNYIHRLYTTVPDTDDWPAYLSRSTRQRFNMTTHLPLPQRGDIVFFNGVDHVALSTGSGTETYTFWPPPDNPSVPGTVDQVKIRTIESMYTYMRTTWPSSPVNVEFGRPTW